MYFLFHSSWPIVSLTSTKGPISILKKLKPLTHNNRPHLLPTFPLQPTKKSMITEPKKCPDPFSLPAIQFKHTIKMDSEKDWQPFHLLRNFFKLKTITTLDRNSFARQVLWFTTSPKSQYFLWEHGSLHLELKMFPLSTFTVL